MADDIYSTLPPPGFSDSEDIYSSLPPPGFAGSDNENDEGGFLSDAYNVLRGVGYGAREGIASIADAGIGGIRFLEEASGGKGELADYIDEKRKPYQKQRAEEVGQFVDEVGPDSIAAAYGMPVGGAAPYIASAFASGGSLPLLAAQQGGLAFGNRYEQSRGAGASPEDSTDAALISGVGQGALSVVPAAPFTSKIASPLLKGGLTAAGGSVLGAASPYIESKAQEVGTGIPIPPEELAQQAKTGALLGGGLGFVGGATTAKRVKPTETSTKIDRLNAMASRFEADISPIPGFDAPVSEPIVQDVPKPKPTVESKVKSVAIDTESLESNSLVKQVINEENQRNQEIKDSLPTPIMPKVEELSPTPDSFPDVNKTRDKLVKSTEEAESAKEGFDSGIEDRYKDSSWTDEELDAYQAQDYEKLGPESFKKFRDFVTKQSPEVPPIQDPSAAITRRAIPKAEGFKQFLSDESGAVDPNLLGIVPFKKAFDKAKEQGGDLYDALHYLASGEHEGVTPLSMAEKYLQGGRGGVVFRTTRRHNTYLRTLAKLAKDDPKIMQFDKLTTEKQIQQQRSIRRLRKVADPIFQLDDAGSKELGEFLAADRIASHKMANQGKPTKEWTDPELKTKGLRPELLPAYRAARKWANTSLEMYGELLSLGSERILDPQKKAIYLAQVKEAQDELARRKYFVFDREDAKFVLESFNATGNKTERSHYQTRREALAGKAVAEARGEQAIVTEATKQYKSKTLDLPPEVLGLRDQFDPDKWTKLERYKEPVGFGARLVRAELTPGYDTNARAGIAKYTRQISRRLAQEKFELAVKPILNEYRPQKTSVDRNGNIIPGESPSATLSFLENVIEDMRGRGHSSLIDGAGRLTNLWLLGATASSGIGQIFEAGIKVPVFAAEQLAPVVGRARATGLIAKYSAETLEDVAMYVADIKAGSLRKNPNPSGTLARRNPKLFKTILRAEIDGLLGADGSNELANFISDRDGKKPWEQHAMGFIAMGEKTQRLYTLGMLDRIAQRKGLKGNARYDYVKENMVDLITLSHPERKTHWMNLVPPIAMYKNYLGNQLRFMRDRMEPKRWRYFVGSLGMTVAVGGVQSIPLFAQLNAVLKSFDKDIRRGIQEYLDDENAEEFMLAGIPALAGVDVSGTLGSAGIIDEKAGSTAEVIGKTVLGPVGAMGAKAFDATMLALDGDYKRAAKQAAPRVVRNAMNVYDLYSNPPPGIREEMGPEYQHNLVDRSGAPIPLTTTFKNAVTMMAGYQPTELSEFYRNKEYLQQPVDLFSGKKQGYAQRIAELLRDGKEDEANAVWDEADEKGLEISEQSVYERLDRFSDTTEYSIKKAPKAVRGEMDRRREELSKKRRLDDPLLVR